MMTEASESMVQSLAQLLQDHVDTVLDGSRILILTSRCLQVFLRLFEQLFPRGPRTGFQALPAHPVDTVPILRTQFLFDVFQITPSLKLIHPSECPAQIDLNIFAFKSLKFLEVQCLPPVCLRGLRYVYSQLEVLIWSRSVSSLKEVISLCGGDLRSALPWPELHTLDFSFNMIKSLDKSLELLNNLRTLDLSHNLLNDCGSYLEGLEELQYLNLGYNLLVSIPELNVLSTTHLQTLILRHNQLSSISGLQYLRSLQKLDLSYNLLVEPIQLSRLSKLKELRELFLEGNPLSFHKEYRVHVAQYLSPKALGKVVLDSKPLCGLEIMSVCVSRETVIRPRPSNSATESSCTGDMTDNCFESGAPKRHKKKKVKVRRASISEPSDSDYEPRRQPAENVLQHQKEIERTISFRDQYGLDWLKYRSHLEEELAGNLTENNPDPTEHSPLVTKDLHLPPILQTSTITDNQSHVPEITGTDKAHSPEEDELTASDILIEQIEGVLEDDLWHQRDRSNERDDDVIDNPISCLVTVCPLVDGKPRDLYWPWVFLDVTELHLREIELRRGQVLIRRDLRRLIDIQTETIRWTVDGIEKVLPLLTLSFYSIITEEQSVTYVVVDNTPTINVENLLKVLRPVLELNLKVTETDGPLKLKCLKCKSEFSQQLNSGRDGERPTEDELPDDGCPDVPVCPHCGSSHVILAPVACSGGASAPSEESLEGAVGGTSIYKGGRNDDGPGSSSSCTEAKDDRDSNNTSGKVTPEVNPCGLTGSFGYGSTTPTPSQSNIPVEEEYCWQISPTSLGTHEILDFRVINHRLKLYLDLEILNGEQEEFQCAIKVPVVCFGNPEEVWNLVVVSSQKIYFLEITGDSRGSPNEWLQLRDSYALTSLTHLHLGLQEQCLYLGFDSSNATYTLLTRNRKSTTTFSRYILDTMITLPSRYLRDLNYRPKEEITPDHRLWHLLHDSLGVDQAPGFLYVLAHYKPEGSIPGAAAVPCANADQPLRGKPSNAALAQGATEATAVSLLLTKTHMYLLEEDHQWLPGDTQELPKKVTIKEEWEIFVMYSVHLFKCAPLHLRIRLYHERVAKQTAWLLWTEDPSLPEEIVEWFRDPWEAIFQINLQLTTHETMESYEPFDS
ncbi:serine/threonine-protein kinase 11-interacting protein [Leptodactylus fuscus]|uniref:serine/threonine-protein kinase 11-interacting protein-like n=1 Tax=Leptodactylus fuscus TaxID=238119 RepID=UPI003F4F33D8